MTASLALSPGSHPAQAKSCVPGAPVVEPRVRSVVVLSDHGHLNGGQAEMAIECALQIARRGRDVCFIAGVGPLDPRLEARGVECHVVGDHDILRDPNRVRAAIGGIWNARAARLLRDCLAARDPAATLVHVHGWAKALSPSIGAVLADTQVAHVFTLHEYFIACPNGGFYDYRAQEICTRPPMGVACLTCDCDVRAARHKMWRVARQAVLRTAGGLPRALREVIYLSPRQRDILIPSIPGDARWHLLPNPVPATPGPPADVARNDGFLFVGRLSREKGGIVAAAAARKAGVPIAFCGEGEERDAILEANPEARMLGWLSKDDLREAMRQARCLVFPSLWYETFGLVVGEAQRLGLPVLVSNSSVAADLVRDGVEGLHLPAGDVERWAEAMTRMLDDEIARRMGEASARAGHRLLEADEHTDMLLEIYEQALARAAPSSLESGRGR